MSDPGDSAWPAPADAPAPRRRHRATLGVLAILLVGALLVGGASGFIVLRHNAQIKAENDRAASVVAAYTAARGTWNAKLAAISAPKPGELLATLYSDSQSPAERDKVAGACADFATYGRKIAALDAPPAIAGVAADVAQRVPAYTDAREQATQERTLFETQRSKLARDLKELAGFCAFYDKEAAAFQSMRDGGTKWKAVLVPKGNRDVVGSWVYTCENSNGCVPQPGKWPGIAPTFHAAFTGPDQMRNLYRDTCPYESLKDECGAMAEVRGQMLAHDQAIESALRAGDQSAFDKATKASEAYSYDDEIIKALSEATGEVYSSADGDPGMVVIYDQVRANLDGIDAAMPQPAESDAIAS